jgi:putative ABC transport system permease protein
VNLRLLTFSLKNLGRRKIRTGLTLLGIAIAIAFAFVLFSVSEGTEALVGNAKRLGPDIDVRGAGGSEFQAGAGSYLDDNYATVLAGIDGVRTAAPIILSGATGDEGQGFTFLLGMTPHDAKEIYGGLKIAEGRSLTDNDNNENVIELGYRISKMSSVNVGDNFSSRGENFEVAGIIAETGGVVDLFGLIPLSTFQSILGIGNKASNIWLWVEDNENVKVVVSEIENLYPELKATEGITILKQTEDFMKFGDAIRVVVAGIALLIGALAAMNTVTMSTVERTREFGAMRSLGASNGYVFKLVLIESTLLCTIGGLLGCLLGYVGSMVIGSFISNFIGINIVTVTLRIPFIAIGIAVTVGVIAGIYPAWRISRQQIVESLRYE